MVLPNFDSDEIWQPCPNRSTLKAKAKAKSKAKEVEVDLPEGLKVPKRGGVWQPASWCKLQVATFVGSTFFFWGGREHAGTDFPNKKDPQKLAARCPFRNAVSTSLLAMGSCSQTRLGIPSTSSLKVKNMSWSATETARLWCLEVLCLVCVFFS